ncbi:rab1 small GTP-binding protein [Trypanosoma cruzi]|nr:rab1 small GTP-binding protein [Trypanosoma cruzi]
MGAKGETAEGQDPWLRAEGRFSMIFIIILSKPQGAPRTRSAPPQEERAIPLQQLNVPVLNLGRNRSRLNPATLERLMQVWGLVGRLAFPLSSSGKARGSSRRIPATGARLGEEAGMVEDASSTKSG